MIEWQTSILVLTRERERAHYPYNIFIFYPEPIDCTCLGIPLCLLSHRFNYNNNYHHHHGFGVWLYSAWDMKEKCDEWRVLVAEYLELKFGFLYFEFSLKEELMSNCWHFIWMDHNELLHYHLFWLPIMELGWFLSRHLRLHHLQKLCRLPSLLYGSYQPSLS